jgi:hypothetical protein
VARLPWPAARVVKASQELSDGQKLVWLEVYALDNDARRCFASAAHLSQLLGKPLDTVERIRRELKDDGLLGTAGAGRGANWWPEMPARFIPAPRAPTVADILAVADSFDGWLRIRRQERLPLTGKGVTSDAIPPKTRAPGKAPPMTPFSPGAGPGKGVTSDAIPTDASSPASIRDGEGVGGEASHLQHCENNAPSSLRDPEEGEKAEEGARARANDEEGAAPSSSGDWREVMAASARAARAKRQGSGL